MTKTAYLYDANGFLSGTREARLYKGPKGDEYILPANATFDPPLAATELFYENRWVGGKWVLAPLPNRTALLTEALLGASTSATALPVSDADVQALKTAAIARVSAATKAVRNQVAGTADDAEIAGWTNKLRIAQAITAGSASDFDRKSFEQEIKLRAIEGETLDVFVGKVLRNAGFYGQAVALIDGAKRSAEDAVKAAKSVAEINKAIATLQARLNAGMAELLKAAA